MTACANNKAIAPGKVVAEASNASVLNRLRVDSDHFYFNSYRWANSNRIPPIKAITFISTPTGGQIVIAFLLLKRSLLFQLLLVGK